FGGIRNGFHGDFGLGCRCRFRYPQVGFGTLPASPAVPRRKRNVLHLVAEKPKMSGSGVSKSAAAADCYNVTFFPGERGGAGQPSDHRQGSAASRSNWKGVTS